MLYLYLCQYSCTMYCHISQICNLLMYTCMFLSNLVFYCKLCQNRPILGGQYVNTLYLLTCSRAISPRTYVIRCSPARAGPLLCLLVKTQLFIRTLHSSIFASRGNVKFYYVTSHTVYSRFYTLCISAVYATRNCISAMYRHT